MSAPTILEKFDFQRAVDIDDAHNISDSQKETIERVKDFGIDKIYFSRDENNCYPAVFVKKVTSFDAPTLKMIAETHRKAWNYKKVPFLYLHNDTEIRFYNCMEPPVFVTSTTNFETELKKKELASCKMSDKEKLKILSNIFSSMAIDSGLIWLIEDAAEIRKKINLQHRIDQYLVESLTRVAEVLNKDLEIELIHRLILRSLFLLYLEDRKATDRQFYVDIEDNAESYFDILKDVNATYRLFEKLDEHFNGNVFSVEKDEIKKVKNEHLEIIRKCFISGYDGISQVVLFADWRLFDFSIIQIELLSRIYENFLAKVDPARKNDSGVHYTPPSFVELILNEKLPVNANEKRYELKILDLACGSGIFLVESFKRLVKRYENHHKKRLTDFETLKKLLTDHIYGIERDGNAIKVATFSLYLALVDCLDPKTVWQVKKLPYLINDPDDKTLKKQGKNLYRRDTIEENKEIERVHFDLVVGNPPFGTETDTRKLTVSIRKYCDKYDFAKEMALPFLHKAVQFAPKGEIALIFNTKVLTNTGTTYQKFRKWLFQECYVEKLYNFSIMRKAPKDFGGQLFGDAVGPISIVFYKKTPPEKPNDRIVYYAPKTYVKSNVLDGIVIDGTDVKYLPREECEKPDTKIWKIAMWGTECDVNIITKISKKNHTLKEEFSKNSNNWIKGTGLLKASVDNLNKGKYIIPNKKIVDTEQIQRYYTSKSALITSQKKCNTKDLKKFQYPFLLVKEGQQNWTYCSTIINFDAFFYKSAFAIKHIENDNYNKFLCGLINSKFATYFLSLISSSWGIERERVQVNEIQLLPFLLNENESQVNLIIEQVNCIIEELEENFLGVNIKNYENRIDEILFDILGLDEKEIIVINDTIQYSLDLFIKKQYSSALHPVYDTKPYVEMLCRELNDFLEDQSLFANATVYNINLFTPLMMIKITHEETKKSIFKSPENIDKELKKLDQSLWDKKSSGIYFRKKMNYYDGDDVYIIRPNQRRFWSQTMAMEDASEIILEILTEEQDED